MYICVTVDTEPKFIQEFDTREGWSWEIVNGALIVRTVKNLDSDSVKVYVFGPAYKYTVNVYE